MSFANTVLMVRPAHFGYNLETASSNPFQSYEMADVMLTHKKALEEFDLVVRTLSKKGMDVIVENDTHSPVKPDAIFPNNWISFHDNGTLVLYPMYAPNRRTEVRWDMVERAKDKWNMQCVVDLSENVHHNVFLEGTGSVVFDHRNKVAYACASPRTNENLFYQLCEKLHYHPIFFYAVDNTGAPIYHTNVMMCMGNGFVVLCTDSIRDIDERKMVCDSLEKDGYDLIEISIDQMKNFAGNMLTLQNNMGKRMLVLSERAYQSLTPIQIERMERDSELVPVSIPTIERIGGGSVRCMLTEIFYNENNNILKID